LIDKAAVALLRCYAPFAPYSDHLRDSTTLPYPCLYSIFYILDEISSTFDDTWLAIMLRKGRSALFEAAFVPVSPTQHRFMTSLINGKIRLLDSKMRGDMLADLSIKLLSLVLFPSPNL
jgi:hypothetical protein